MGRAVWRNGSPDHLPAVGDAAHEEDGAIGHFRAGQGEIFFGVFRDAIDFELIPNLLESGLNVGDAPAVGNQLKPGQGDVRGNQLDVIGFVIGGGIFLPGARLQGPGAAGLIDGGVFLEPGENDFLVFALEGAAHQIIEQGQKDGGAQGKDQGIPEAEAKGEIAEELI